MTSQPLLLLSDHRGEGLSQRRVPFVAANFQVEVAANLRQTLAGLARIRPDLILVDPLAGGGSIELEAIERARPQDQALPVLVVSDERDPVHSLQGTRMLQSGLWDLIRRDASDEEYLLRIELLLARARKADELEQLRHRAIHDDRTDLLRPRAFQERLREHFSAAQRHGLVLALMLIDLDRFGQINKRYDHTVGDQVIAQVGAVIRHALRTEDIAGRLGGDEFAVLLPYTGKLDAARVAQRLLEEIRRLSDTASPPGVRLEISASMGFETFDGKDIETVEVLRKHAEEALRAAKQGGGDQGIYFRALTS